MGYICEHKFKFYSGVENSSQLIMKNLASIEKFGTTKRQKTKNLFIISTNRDHNLFYEHWSRGHAIFLDEKIVPS